MSDHNFYRDLSEQHRAARKKAEADAEALAEALNWIVDNSTEDQVRHVALIALSARYRGERPSSIRTLVEGRDE